MSAFGDGLYQFGGVPITSGLLTGKMFYTSARGRSWYVNAVAGSDGNTGRSPVRAFLTMAKAFSKLASGDIIYFVGKVTEQLVTPVNIFDVTVVGCGNRPHHADATPAGGNFAASQWAPAAGGTAAQATVRVIQQGWRFVNILFTAIDANGACIELVRNSGAADAERDASHTEVIGCRFSGAGKGIRAGATSFVEVVNHVLVDGNRFDNMTYGIHVAVISNYWTIRNNEFRNNTNHVVADVGYAFIHDNIFGAFTTDSVELPGSSDAKNIVTKNYLSGTYSSVGGYTVSDTTDEWSGNFNGLAGGVTVSNPA